MAEDVLEAEAVLEEDEAEAGAASTALPATTSGGDVSVLRDEARTVAIAAAGGVVAGAATVAVVKAASRVAAPKRKKRSGILRRQKQNEIIASRSFLVDVHLLGR